jgi:hypothetical protein
MIVKSLSCFVISLHSERGSMNASEESHEIYRFEGFSKHCYDISKGLHCDMTS